MAAQQLLQALQALYHGAPDVKDQANKWLEQFQGSTEAWQVTNDILHNAGAGMEAHYFCAQTLRTKASEGCGGVACGELVESMSNEMPLDQSGDQQLGRALARPAIFAQRWPSCAPAVLAWPKHQQLHLWLVQHELDAPLTLHSNSIALPLCATRPAAGSARL